MRRNRLSAVFVTLGLAMLGALGVTHAREVTRFDLAPVNAACLPDATGSVTVFHTDPLGVDILRLVAHGLPPNTEFAVFLTSADAFATPPFGSTSYLADFTTNAMGNGTVIARAIVAESFVTTVAGAPPVRGRADLDHLVFWFADPADVPPCFNFQGATPFDGDGNAGPAAMSSRDATGLEGFPQ